MFPVKHKLADTSCVIFSQKDAILELCLLLLSLFRNISAPELSIHWLNSFTQLGGGGSNIRDREEIGDEEGKRILPITVVREMKSNLPALTEEIRTPNSVSRMNRRTMAWGTAFLQGMKCLWDWNPPKPYCGKQLPEPKRKPCPVNPEVPSHACVATHLCPKNCQHLPVPSQPDSIRPPHARKQLHLFTILSFAPLPSLNFYGWLLETSPPNKAIHTPSSR